MTPLEKLQRLRELADRMKQDRCKLCGGTWQDHEEKRPRHVWAGDISGQGRADYAAATARLMPRLVDVLLDLAEDGHRACLEHPPSSGGCWIECVLAALERALGADHG